MVNKDASQIPDNNPRFSYGYIVVAVAFLILMASLGLISIFGVFFNPLLDEFGWTRAMTSGAFSLSTIIHGLLGIIMGGLSDRFGPRLVLTFCSLLSGAGYLLMSQLSAIWQLYLFYGVIIGIGMSGVWVPLVSSIARWFVRRRSMMTGIVVSGAGIGGMVAPLVISRLIAACGWRLSYVIQGGIVLLIMGLGAQFLRRAPAQTGQLPYGGNKEREPALPYSAQSYSLREAVCTAQFWLYFIILFCSGFCMFAIIVHIVPHAIDLGIAAVSAANVLAIIMGVSILGNFVLGGAGDRIGNRRVFIIGFVMMSAALFYLRWAEGVWMLYIFALVFGFVHGGMSTVEAPLAAGLFGLNSLGLVYGVVLIGFTIGAAVGPLVAGYIFDLTGSYQAAFLVCTASGMIGLLLTVVLRPTRKLGIKL